MDIIVESVIYSALEYNNGRCIVGVSQPYRRSYRGRLEKGIGRVVEKLIDYLQHSSPMGTNSTCWRQGHPPAQCHVQRLCVSAHFQLTYHLFRLTFVSLVAHLCLTFECFMCLATIRLSHPPRCCSTCHCHLILRSKRPCHC